MLPLPNKIENSLSTLRDLIFWAAAEGKSSARVVNRGRALFYFSATEDVLARDGFRFDPPPMTDPDSVSIEWSHWAGVIVSFRNFDLDRLNAINGFSMNWLRDVGGQNLLRVVSEFRRKNPETPLPINQIEFDDFSKVSSENLIYLDYQYKFIGRDFLGVPIPPLGFRELILRLDAFAMSRLKLPR
jgi:hypothetical protein